MAPSIIDSDLSSSFPALREIITDLYGVSFGFTLQVNGLTCGYAGTGPSNLYEVLQAAGVSEAQVAREDITQKSTKTIPLRLERAVTQYGDFQFA